MSLRYAIGMTRCSILCLAMLASAASAQTNGSVRSTREAYGARLDAQSQPNNLNAARVNNRIVNRVNSRLSLRIERYRVGQTSDPTAAFAAPRDDGARTAPVIAPPQQQTEQDPQ